MAFYNEFFIEENNQLIHIGSCCGSDTPDYFDEVRSMKEWNRQLEKVKQMNGFYPHSDKHPFPWSSYKTSDNLIVLRKNYSRKWFEVWKQKYEVWIDNDKSTDNNECNFIKIGSNRETSREGDGITLILPKLKK